MPTSVIHVLHTSYQVHLDFGFNVEHLLILNSCLAVVVIINICRVKTGWVGEESPIYLIPNLPQIPVICL